MEYSTALEYLECLNGWWKQQWDIPERPAPQEPGAIRHVPFDATTTQRADFREWEMPKRQPPGVVHSRKAEMPFEGESTYNSHFHKHPLPVIND